MNYKLMLGLLLLVGCTSYENYYIPEPTDKETVPYEGDTIVTRQELASDVEEPLKPYLDQGYVVIGTAQFQQDMLDEGAVLAVAREHQAELAVVFSKVIQAGFSPDQNQRMMNQQMFGGVGYTPQTNADFYSSSIYGFSIYFMRRAK